MSNSLLSFVGGMGAGAMSQYERNKDRARQDRQDDRLDRQEQRQMTLDAQSKELHDERMEDVKRNKANRQSDIEAAKPVVAQNAWEQSVQGMTPEQQQDLAEKMSYGEVEGTKTYEVQGKSYGADKAASDVALAQANTPEAKQARLVQNMRNTARFSEADQLETAHRQGKAADMTLRAGDRAEKAAKLQEANTVWNTAVMDSVKKHGNVHAGLAAIMSESEIGPVSGVKFSSVPSKDGKTVQYIATDASGKQSVFKTYATGEAGAMEALQDSMRVSPETQLQFMAERQARAAASEKAKQETEMHNARIKFLGAQGLHLSRSGKAGAAGEAIAPTWNEKADAFLQDNFKSKNVETGAVDFDGGGFEFAQTLALGMSRRNGGNTAAATAYAIKADNALKVLSKGDPVLLNEMRINALNEMRRPVLTPTSQRMTDRTEQELLASKNKK